MPVPPEQRRPLRLAVRLSADEEAALATVAAEHGLTQSEAMRRLVRGASGLALTADPTLLPSVTELVEQLRRAGINLNQVARAMNEGRAGYEPDLARTLLALTVAVEGTIHAYREIAREPRRRARSALASGEGGR